MLLNFIFTSVEFFKIIIKLLLMKIVFNNILISFKITSELFYFYLYQKKIIWLVIYSELMVSLNKLR